MPKTRPQTANPAGSTSRNDSVLALMLLGLSVALTYLSYLPGLEGVFLLDDSSVLSSLNSYGGVTDATSLLHFIWDDPSGPTGRPVSMLSFLLDDLHWPGDPATYRHTNLLIHLINGLLIALLTMKLASVLAVSRQAAPWIAAFTAMLWLLHPLNTSTTLYIIQRMTQLSALFSLLALVLYSYGRMQLDGRPRRGYLLMTTGVLPVGLMAVFSKENGALLPLFILVLEATIFRAVPGHRLLKPWLGLFVAAPLVIMTGYVIHAWDSLTAGFHLRPFSLIERLLTEARVLVDYLGYILAPRTEGTGLFHDDFVISRGLTAPPETLVAIAILVALLVSAIWRRKRQPVYSLAVLWFFAGHLMESTFLNLELYFEHRNYMPMVGPLFAIAFYLYTLTANWLSGRSMQVARILLFIVPMAGMVYLCGTNAAVWNSPSSLFPTWAEQHPESPNARIHLATYLSNSGRQDLALPILEDLYAQDPGRLDTALLAAAIACNHTAPTGIKGRHLIDNADMAAYNGGFFTSLTDLVAALSAGDSCSAISSRELHELLYALEANPTFSQRSFEYAHLLVQHAKLFVAEGRIDPAMKLLDRARERRGNMEIARYQALLLYSAGLHDDALKYIDIAIEADAQRPRFSPSRSEELKGIGRTIWSNQHKNEH